MRETNCAEHPRPSEEGGEVSIRLNSYTVIDPVKAFLHDCDYTGTTSQHWCDGEDEYLGFSNNFLYAPWDQKHIRQILEQLKAESFGYLK